MNSHAFIMIVIVILASSDISGQTSFRAGSISSFNAPAGIFSGDIDMDGDNDIVAGSGNNGISLWINQGGNPISWTKQTIDNNSGVCLSVSIADISKDGRPDIVAISTSRDQIIYYENEGGEPTIWSKNIISSFTDPHEIYVCDFDRDGYQDVFAAGMSETGEISWWHNDGGNPVQWTKQAISIHEPGARSVHVGDIDGDGDMDVAGAIFATDEVTWWRNDGGTPVNFTKQVVDNSFDGSHRIQAADMDSDGDLDLVGTAYMGASITIWKNEGGSPVSWSKHIVDDELGGAVIGFAVDINSDGFMDILGTAQGTHTIAWYENKGLAEMSFKKRVLQDDFAGVWPAYACDLDGDLDIDLLAGGFNINEIRWYENKQVGRFSSQIKVNDTPTKLGFFVPEEYNPDEKYKLIVALHTCGDEIEYSRYRYNLIPLCLEQNAIMVAPDCQNNIGNTDIPDPAFIIDAIEYAARRFNIDEDYIYLTGGSCNGRTALKYGLEKIYDFRGVIPFNPYIPEWTEGYYDFSSDMPVCFAVGTLDPNYNLAHEAFDQLLEHQGRTAFIPIHGKGHEFYFEEFTELMLECIYTIDSLRENSSSANLPTLKSGSFNIFPNPFSSTITVRTDKPLKGKLDVSFMDLTGKIIYQKSYCQSEIGDSQFNIQLGEHDIPSGLYFILMETGGEKYLSKVIKE